MQRRTGDDAERGLTPEERREASAHQEIRAPVIYETIRLRGVEEIARPASSLWWSGVAAGLAISLSVFCEGFLHALLPDAPWRPAVSSFGYCIGFLIVILGRLQLFTENTLTAVLPLLATPTRANAVGVARLTAVVFAANMVGSLASAAMAVFVGLAPEAQLEAALAISRHFAEKSAIEMALHAVPAGFLVAAIVWSMPIAGGAGFWVIVAFTYMIALGDTAHVVAGSTELFLLTLSGEHGWYDTVVRGIVPAFVGNVVGGTGFFALIAYAQVREEL